MSGSTADVSLSSCGIKLVRDRRAAFAEALRVLKPGGRWAISDVVTTGPLPRELQERMSALTGCISGAMPVDELRQILLDVGFAEVRIDVRPESRVFIRDWIPGAGSENYVASATSEGVKPKSGAAAKPESGACGDPGCWAGCGGTVR